MAKRIFFVSPGTDLGGGEVSLLTLIGNLNRQYHTPIICTYADGKFAQSARQFDCPVHILGYTGVPSQLRFVLQLAGLIKKERADLVHVNTLDIRAGLATRLARKPLIGHLRVIFPTTWVDRTFVNWANKTIAVSNAVRDHFCLQEGTTVEQFETIYNAVDTQPTVAQNNIRKELKLPTDVALVGVVGRIDPWKGMETFVAAAALLAQDFPDTHFLIAGAPGPAQEEQAYDAHLKQKVKDLNLSSTFHFLGYRSDALNIIKQLTALVVPSRILKTPEGIKTEGFGRVAAEGLAMQTPVIASRVGGLPEIIEHEKTGLLFLESDPKDLAHNLTRLLTNPELGEQLSQAGKRRFDTHFSVKSHLQHIQDLYDQILGT